MICPRCKEETSGWIGSYDHIKTCYSCLTPQEDKEMREIRLKANRETAKLLAQNAGEPYQETID